MPLGQGMTEMLEAVRDRVEVSGHGSTWQVTAGSFDGALGYARERFEDPAVLARADRNRWWPRVTLTVTTDPHLAASAPPLDELAVAVAPEHAAIATAGDDCAEWDDAADASRDAKSDDFAEWELDAGHDDGPLPASLEVIFASQEQEHSGIPRQRGRHRA